jgi:hypothetical protein
LKTENNQKGNRVQRDNEKIIELCQEMSITNRALAIELIKAGAPAEVLQGISHILEMADNIPQRLADNRHYGEIVRVEPEASRTGVLIAVELISPLIQELKFAVEQLKS